MPTHLFPGDPYSNSFCWIQMLYKFSVFCLNPAYVCLDSLLAIFITSSEYNKPYPGNRDKLSRCLSIFKVISLCLSFNCLICVYPSAKRRVLL